MTKIPFEILFLLLLIGIVILIWDFFLRTRKKISSDTGIPVESTMVSLKGSKFKPTRELVSEHLGLASRPDAIVEENGFIIPVMVKPTGKKVRDRHVVELLVHLRLIEEIEDKRPPYGILIIGSKQRRVKIINSKEKQNWLDSLLKEMRSIQEKNIPAIPSPAVYKCKSCDVRTHCSHSAFKA